MRHVVLAFTALFLLFTPLMARAAQNAGDGTIGTVIEVEGTATITPKGKPAVKAARGTRLHMNDTIATGEKSKIFLLFIDETKISLSENGHMTIDKYVFDPDNAEHNSGTFSITEGAFKYISGLLAKKKEPDVNFNTAYGSVGIRGTIFESGRVRDTYGVGVTKGRVRVRNQAGEVVVGEGKSTLMKGRNDRPSPPAPLPEEFAQAFTLITAFAIGGKGIDGLIDNALPGMRDQRQLFKMFQQQNGMLPGLDAIPGAPAIPGLPGLVPQQEEPQQNQKKKKAKVNPLDMFRGFGR
jgi:hypothetical protein